MSKMSGIPAMSVDMKSLDCNFGLKNQVLIQSREVVWFYSYTKFLLKKTTKLAVNQNKM